MVEVKVHLAVLDLLNQSRHGIAGGVAEVNGLAHGKLLVVGHRLAGDGLHEALVTLAVGILGLEASRLLVAGLHLSDSLLKAGDDLVGTLDERDGLVAVVAAVELRAVVERAAVVDGNLSCH